MTGRDFIRYVSSGSGHEDRAHLLKTSRLRHEKVYDSLTKILRYLNCALEDERSLL